MVNAIPIVHTLTIPGHAMKKEQMVKMGFGALTVKLCMGPGKDRTTRVYCIVCLNCSEASPC